MQYAINVNATCDLLTR